MARGHRTIATVAVSLAVALSSCGNGGSVLESLSSDDDSEDRGRSYDDVFGALPDQDRPAERRRGTDRAEYVVVGEITDVVPGFSMSWNKAGTERFIHEFGSDEADASTIHLQVEVTRVVSANEGVDTSNPGAIQVGLPVDPDVDVDAARQELTGLGTVVLILKRSSVFVYDGEGVPDGLAPDEGIWAILESGAFIGDVADSGRVEFPAMSGEARDELLPEGGITLDELIAAAREM